MKPENVCSLLISESFIKYFDGEGDVDLLISISDFLKVEEATRHQKVSFGHFLRVIENMPQRIRDQFNYFDGMFTVPVVTFFDSSLD